MTYSRLVSFFDVPIIRNMNVDHFIRIHPAVKNGSIDTGDAFAQGRVRGLRLMDTTPNSACRPAPRFTAGPFWGLPPRSGAAGAAESGCENSSMRGPPEGQGGGGFAEANQGSALGLVKKKEERFLHRSSLSTEKGTLHFAIDLRGPLEMQPARFGPSHRAGKYAGWTFHPACDLERCAGCHRRSEQRSRRGRQHAGVWGPGKR